MQNAGQHRYPDSPCGAHSARRQTVPVMSNAAAAVCFAENRPVGQDALDRLIVDLGGEAFDRRRIDRHRSFGLCGGMASADPTLKRSCWTLRANSTISRPHRPATRPSVEFQLVDRAAGLDAHRRLRPPMPRRGRLASVPRVVAVLPMFPSLAGLRLSWIPATITVTPVRAPREGEITECRLVSLIQHVLDADVP